VEHRVGDALGLRGHADAVTLCVPADKAVEVGDLEEIAPGREVGVLYVDEKGFP
jgi:hypothetical protein